MAVNPISSPLPADLPTNWQTGQTVAPNGSDVGLAQQYGYNYQSQQINAAQQAINAIGTQFPNLYGKGDTVPIANGGTGGTSVAAALANLGAQPGFNLLVNPRFKYNSRGQSTYTGAVWTVDGWNGFSADQIVTVSDSGISVVCSYSGQSTNTAAIQQEIPNAAALAGKTVTLSVDVSGINSQGALLLIVYRVGDGSNQYNNVAITSTGITENTFTFPEGTNRIRIWIRGADPREGDASGTGMTLTAAKLELGSVSTLAADLATAQDETIEQLRLDMYDLDPGRPAWVLTQNENLLDNWYFVGGGSQQGGGQFPINQRGQTTVNNPSGDVEYVSDRWLIARANYQLVSNGATISYIGGSGSDNGYLSQRIDIPRINPLQSYTASFLLEDGNLFCFSFSIPTTSLSKDSPLLSNMFRISFLNNTTFYQLIFRSYTDTPSTVIAAKLEPGFLSTLARKDDGGNWVLNDPPPNFQQELAKCQRYQYMTPPTSEWVRASYNTGGTAYFNIPCPAPMRANPTVAQSTRMRVTEFGVLGNILPDITFSAVALGASIRLAARGEFTSIKDVSLELVGVLFDSNL